MNQKEGGTYNRDLKEKIFSGYKIAVTYLIEGFSSKNSLLLLL